MPQPANKRLVTEASTAFDGRYKDTTKATGANNPYIIRTIANPEQTNSKWRELTNTAIFQTTKPDPVYFFGWNADKAAGAGDVAEPALYMGFEADYWDSPTNRTMEWYIGVVRADRSGPQFRPFAFTAARDSNLDLSASVQVDIGNNANGSTRSLFNVVGDGNSYFAVTPTTATFAMPVVMTVSAGTSASMQLNTTAVTNPQSLQFLDNGVAKWNFQHIHGTSDMTIRDEVNNRVHTQFYSGATSTAAALIVNAMLASASGTTANRPNPNNYTVGTTYYDTTLGKPVWTNGAAWRDAAGVAV